MHSEKKIPTVAGLLFVALFVGLVIYLGERSSAFSLLFAARGVAPQNIEITNQTESSASISWTTQTPVVGDVLVGDDGQVSIDDRDSTILKTQTTTHHITIRDLTPDTQYQVTLRLNGRKADGTPLSITTAPSLPLSEENHLGPAYGMIMYEEGKPATGAIVYLQVEGGQKLSTTVSPSGSWLIALNRLRTPDRTEYLTPSERMTEDILVRENADKNARAITDTLNDSPVPVIVIGKTYDFRKQQAQAQPQPQVSQAVLGTSTVSLVAPKEGEAIPSNVPLIHGTGIPGKTVVLTLGITTPYSDTTTVGGDGVWRYTPKQALAAGRQSVTMSTEDSSGKTVATTHLFEILKSGTQVLGDATPSATLSMTPTTFVEASPSPTSTLSGVAVPTSGSMLPTIVVTLMGIGLVISGAVLLPQ